MLVVVPEMGLLEAWKREFQRVHCKPEFQPFYQQDVRYQIFIHQAVLSGLILRTLEQDEIQELPEDINYPLNLHATEVPPQHRPASLNDLVTCRHEGYEALREDLKGIAVKEPLKSWLDKRFERLSAIE
jgi:hypothetical protein